MCCHPGANCFLIGTIFRPYPRRESFERQQLAGIYAHHFVINCPVDPTECPVPAGMITTSPARTVRLTPFSSPVPRMLGPARSLTVWLSAGKRSGLVRARRLPACRSPLSRQVYRRGGFNDLRLQLRAVGGHSFTTRNTGWITPLENYRCSAGTRIQDLRMSAG